ncbi:tryptophan--tRNA ligase MSW1 NDAI_0H00810 [Naumovozyma dairenensis CBS 421]|uniref:Tryptophan--tRNA ligase, mitochondrial n=1 Tax=Naumovozyma dairenensis (strain ATCC 10597 / BCRC 20456 / CBS 421 / NBRC 0211 / NRRL Y-12639) TaxID=1071378 RepID=G0WEP4_NAUDC|nr:hypothetical protein NDAI_0H00810 [Naumovozyma dairenensis CBS 421]CCD26255.1 hypothetical protein NDAI_0H00810 [Naumovozyma dairenensis CBS 421]
MLQRNTPRSLIRSNHLKTFARGIKSTVQNTDYKLQQDDIPQDGTIFSMIQPTGMFHLGNYLGATRVWSDICNLKTSVSLKDSPKLIFGVADLHAITVPKPHPNSTQLRKYRHEAIASILAVGVDPKKAIIMYQSSIPEHTQLHWILSTIASMGYLNRMTQWKSKSKAESTADTNVRLGLFSYPILQAADILLYKSTHVPVGDDQAQHLELCRSLAVQFNKMYRTKIFPIPRTILAPTKKILSLKSSEKKMSKSDPNHDSVIFMNETSDEISRKIKSALTDSIVDHFEYDPENRPSVSNLINILSGIQRKSIEEVDQEISCMNNYKSFKNHITEVLVEGLKGPRLRFEQLMKDPAYLETVLEQGTQGIGKGNSTGDHR